MRELRPDKNIISVGGKEYNIILTLSVMEKLQKQYENLSEVFGRLVDFNASAKELAEIAVVFINDDIECHNEDFPHDKWQPITAEWLCRRIALNDKDAEGKILMVDLTLALLNAFKFSMPEGEEEADPN